MKKSKSTDSPIYGLLDDIEDEVLPKPKIKKTTLPQGSEKVKLDNVVNISEQAVQRILNRVDTASRHIAADLLENEVPILLSYDNATAYAETVLRDALGIDVSIDDDVTKVLAHLNKLSIIYQYSTMVKLPRSIRKLFVTELTKSLVLEAVVDMKNARTGRKYSQNLRELTAHVRGHSTVKKDETEYPLDPNTKKPSRVRHSDVTTKNGIKRSRK